MEGRVRLERQLVVRNVSRAEGDGAVQVGQRRRLLLRQSLLTPVLFWLFGREPTERLLAQDAQAPVAPQAREAF